MPAGRPRREDGRNAETVAHIKYQREAYDKITIAFEKTTKEKLTIAAKLAGQSLAQYVAEACDRRIAEDSVDNPELIRAMQDYYYNILLPARAEREEHVKDKNTLEKMQRPELELVRDDADKLRAINWIIRGLQDEIPKSTKNDIGRYMHIKKAPED